MDLRQHYDAISEAARGVRQESLADLTPLEAAHGVIAEIRLWEEILDARAGGEYFCSSS